MELGQKIRYQSCVDKCFICLSTSSRNHYSLVFVCIAGDVFRACTLQIGLMGQYGATFGVEPTSL